MESEHDHCWNTGLLGAGAYYETVDAVVETFAGAAGS